MGRRDVSGLGDVRVVVVGSSDSVVVVDIAVSVSVGTVRVRIVLAHFERVGARVIERVRVRVV